MRFVGRRSSVVGRRSSVVARPTLQEAEGSRPHPADRCLGMCLACCLVLTAVAVRGSGVVGLGSGVWGLADIVSPMRVGYQGEPGSYSYRASDELLPGAERVGFASFVAAFAAMAGGEVERLVLPIENSTTGSVLPVLDRLVEAPASIVAEHLVEVRHALLGLPGAGLEDVQTVRSGCRVRAARGSRRS